MCRVHSPLPVSINLAPLDQFSPSRLSWPHLAPGDPNQISLVFGRVISVFLECPNGQGCLQERRQSPRRRRVRDFEPGLKEPQDEISLGLTRGQEALSGSISTLETKIVTLSPLVK